MADPLISCIVPTYHSELHLGAALASIRAQSWRSVEIVVADDDSAPTSRDTIEEIASRHGARFERHARAGPAATRNFGLGRSAGRFVAFLDADDLWRPEKLARQMACLHADPQLLICATLIRVFSDVDDRGQVLRDETLQAVPGFLMTTLLARREAFDVVGPLDPELWFSDSADWFLRVADLGLPVRQVPEALTLHRVHGGNLSRQRDGAASHEFLRVIKTSLDRRRGATETTLAPAELPGSTLGGARRRVSIGPVTAHPSWEWIGPDTARELARHHDVTIFERFDAAPPADVVFIVKERPPLRFVARVVEQGARMVYLPLDAFRSEDELRTAAGFLKACSAILSHSEALMPYLERHGRHVGLVEHHARLTLPEPAPYKSTGYVLWSGGMQHLPYLLAWLARHPLPAEVKVITDLGNPMARHAARNVARHLGVPLDVGDSSINGLEARPWDTTELLHMMRECRAIIDIKGGGFGQATKPPTKGQQAIASGIPFACNPDASTAQYLRRRGFDLASPLDPARWLAPAYWAQTRDFGIGLREDLAIEKVVQPYRRTIDRLCDAAQLMR